ncbi:oxygen tolerance protein [Leptospira ryugenii]|uniref:Oxygen tolerance protein n=1 Tax=Leptospira ryugenii TaxID=1917863 RepID=A0A2P2E4W7_9LEPT|nr:BatD family protein [Leptospira ryugenii]GBF51921.1 oxygen tolerance protein [Leptospira ryugenii]
MKNFGRSVFFLFLFSFGVLSAQNVQFYLEPSQIEAGEVAILHVKYQGDADLQPVQKRYESKHVQVYFLGHSSETQIINFKVSKSKLLKYQVSSDKVGKHQVPKIIVLIGNETIESPDLFFEVLPTRPKVRSQRPQSLIDQLLQGMEPDFGPNEKPEVGFQLNKYNCYLGEPVIGYYVLYYSNMNRPYLERDPNRSISYPFFLSETLQGVTVQIEPEVLKDGLLRRTLVYGKEIYSLTPLKPGRFQLGETKFVVGDGLQFGAVHDSLPVKPAMIEVKPLPKPSPIGYQGAIGDYTISHSFPNRKAYDKEPYYFTILVKGEGTGAGIEPPLELKGFEDSIHFISKSKKKSFQRLPSGEYGFYSEVSFQYSWEPNGIGERQLPKAKIVFFLPKENRYEIRELKLPSIQVEPKPDRTLSKPKKDPSFSLSNYFLWSIGLIVFSAVMFGSWLKLQAEQKQKVVWKEMEEILGQKKGIFLSDYLKGKGLPETEIQFLLQLQSSSPSKSWFERMKELGRKDQNKIQSIFKILNERSMI